MLWREPTSDMEARVRIGCPKERLLASNDSRRRFIVEVDGRRPNRRSAFHLTDAPLTRDIQWRHTDIFRVPQHCRCTIHGA